MKRFIKNNLVLIIVLGLSGIAACTLLVWTVMEYIQMSNYIAQTEKLREEIGNLIKKTPAPVEGNVPLIKEDMTLYTKAARNMRGRLGHPLRPALEAFIRELRLVNGEKISLKQFKEDFFTEWNKNESNAQKGVEYKTFQRRFKNWGDAMQKFRTLAVDATSEPVTDANIDEVFQSALGVPRTMGGSAEKMLRFMMEYKLYLTSLAAKNNVEIEPEGGSTLSIPGNSFSFMFPTGNTFAEMRMSYPSSMYPRMAQHWEIIGDIVKRASTTGIKSFLSFRKRAMEPERVGSFDVFHYSIEVTGTMENIRKMVSALDQAYEDNRMYVVRSIFLYAVDDQAQVLFEPEALPSLDEKSPETVHRPMPGRRLSRRRIMEEQYRSDDQAALELARQKAEQEADLQRPPFQRKAYGKKVVGASDLCRAIIDVEYIMESDN